MKQRIRLTESQLYNVIRECVQDVISENNRLNEGMFDRFNRTKGAQTAAKALNGINGGEYFFNPNDRQYYYRASNGAEYPTGVILKSGQVGKNWNPFGPQFKNGQQITPELQKDVQERLKRYDSTERRSIEQKIKDRCTVQNQGWNQTAAGRHNGGMAPQQQKMDRMTYLAQQIRDGNRTDATASEINALLSAQGRGRNGERTGVTPREVAISFGWSPVSGEPMTDYMPTTMYRDW